MQVPREDLSPQNWNYLASRVSSPWHSWAMGARREEEEGWGERGLWWEFILPSAPPRRFSSNTKKGKQIPWTTSAYHSGDRDSSCTAPRLSAKKNHGWLVSTWPVSSSGTSVSYRKWPCIIRINHVYGHPSLGANSHPNLTLCETPELTQGRVGSTPISRSPAESRRSPWNSGKTRTHCMLRGNKKFFKSLKFFRNTNFVRHKCCARGKTSQHLGNTITSAMVVTKPDTSKSGIRGDWAEFSSCARNVFR